MDIYIDCPEDKNQFFVSTPLDGGRESISFDWTVKGHRIILQRYKEERNKPNIKPSGEWDTIYLSNGKFVSKEHIVWYDLNKEDWVNGRVWETIKEWPFQADKAHLLEKLISIIREDFGKIENHQREIKELEKELKNIIKFLRAKK